MSNQKLIPPDPKQCQAMIRSGCFPTATEFMKLGPGREERCTEKPVVIATEKEPAEDGQIGSMSLCPNCLVNFERVFGTKYATLSPIQHELKTKKAGKKSRRAG